MYLQSGRVLCKSASGELKSLGFCPFLTAKISQASQMMNWKERGMWSLTWGHWDCYTLTSRRWCCSDVQSRWARCSRRSTGSQRPLGCSRAASGAGASRLSHSLQLLRDSFFWTWSSSSRKNGEEVEILRQRAYWVINKENFSWWEKKRECLDRELKQHDVYVYMYIYIYMWCGDLRVQMLSEWGGWREEWEAVGFCFLRRKSLIMLLLFFFPPCQPQILLLPVLHHLLFSYRLK